MMRARGALLAITIALSMVACESVQTTKSGAVGVERSQHMSPLVSEQDLRQGAVQAYKEVLGKEQAKGTLNADAGLTARVRGIARHVIPATAAFRPDAPSWPWEVNVIRSDELNAWCMPGGKIAFYSGLITKLALTDDEIAAVMGHEIAHALREHARERASETVTAQIALSAAVALLGGGQGAFDMARMAYGVTVGLPHSRLHETEADRIGVELAARAGYDPRAAVGLWQKMGKAGGGKTPELLSTHPSAETRTQDLEVYAARVMPLYEQARQRH
jgi:predicted Zn-dependent protease